MSTSSSVHYSLSCERPKYLSPMARRDLSDAQGARVLARLRARLDRVHGGNGLAFSRELGCSQAALWKLLNERSAPSLATTEALARLERVSVESILYSTRESAARIARDGGVPPAAIARVLAEPEADRPVLWWIDRMRLVAQTLSPADDAPPSSAALPSSPSPARKPAA